METSPTTSIATWYRRFARQAAGDSPTYQRLAEAVADDPDLLHLLADLPEEKRQPNLLFAAVRYLEGPVDDAADFRWWVCRHWSEVAATMRQRRTQTNEAGRCATLLPVLATLPEPLALLEVGASAGLCLIPDAYRYRYGEHVVGDPDSPVELECAVSGNVPLPSRIPEVVWRAGLDLNPLDVREPDTMRWLEALVWPEQEHRRARLQAAARLVAATPPRLVRGDLLTDLPALAAQAPSDATLVVFHTAVITYVPVAHRRAAAELLRRVASHWISNEARDVFPDISQGLDVPPDSFVLALDGRPVGYAAQHGKALHWL